MQNSGTEAMDITAAGSQLVIKAISKVALDIYELAKRKAADSIRKWRAEKGIEDLYKRIENVRRVKTIWQIDRNVDLQEFYCPPHLLINEKRIRVNNLDEIDVDGPLLLEGIAGQGKSTFLRYICSQEMIVGNTIPVFIELRRIEKGDSILNHASRFLEILGIELDDNLIKDLLVAGKITLFLDGFDEVSDDARGSVINDIEQLSQLVKGRRVVVTSRPDTSLRSSPYLSIVKIDNLKKNEYKEVVYKISETREYGDSLIALVEAHKGEIKNLLCTPLLITLLVVSYKSYQQVPTRLPDFYNGLFQILLQRHDGSKPNFVRKRKSGLNDSIFRAAFDSLCFQTKLLRKESFSHAEMISCAQKALESVNQLEVAPEDFLADVADITCLVVRDGEECRFIHKSVQEFFVASFLKEKPEEYVKKFYSAISKNGFSTRWIQELDFLEEVDRYRYSKFFLIPHIKQLLSLRSNITNAPFPGALGEIQRKLLDPFTISMPIVPKDSPKRFSVSIEFEETLVSPIPSVVFDTFGFCLVLSESLTKRHKQLLKKFENPKHTEYVLPLKQLALIEDLKGEVSKFVADTVEKLFEKGRTAEDFLKREDQFSYEKELFENL